MVRLIAALLCALGIWQLFRLGREKEVRTSPALWIPTLWLFIGATRNLSEWLRLSAPSGQPTQYLEGNPVDQTFLATMLILGLIVLISRGQRAWENLQSNIPILLYFVYCAISILWSDFPDVAFRRWFRASGDVLMVLIVVSDPNWITAVRRVFARVAFVAIPISILFIRYFPEFGRTYSRGGLTAWCGVATGKNSLGIICMVFGLSTLCRFLEVYRNKEDDRRTGQLVAYGVTTGMAVYLLYEAHSATSSATFAIACGPLVLTQLFRSARKPLLVHLMVIAILGLTVASLFFDAGGGMVEQLGRDSTLTGRTDIWRSAFAQVQNPVFGTGFESFWVGPRLTRVEHLIGQGVNQAHDGYIEVYLNLGWVGVALLAGILISAYRRVVRAVRIAAPLASLGLAYFVATAAYNCTEAGIKMMSPLWIALLLFAMAALEATARTNPSPRLPELNHREDLTESTSKTAEPMATVPAWLDRTAT